MDFSSFRLYALFPFAKKLIDRIKETPFWARLALLFLPMLFCWLLICQASLNRHAKLQLLAEEITTLMHRSKALERQRNLAQKIEMQARQASPDYLHQTLESMPLLQRELKRVSSLAEQFPDNLSLKERVLFLNSGQNQIRFEPAEGPELILASRVQMDLGDLRKFLEAVEGDRYDATQKKPFFLIKKFDLRKCDEKGDEKIYSIHVELLRKI